LSFFKIVPVYDRIFGNSAANEGYAIEKSLEESIFKENLISTVEVTKGLGAISTGSFIKGQN